MIVIVDQKFLTTGNTIAEKASWHVSERLSDRSYFIVSNFYRKKLIDNITLEYVDSAYIFFLENIVGFVDHTVRDKNIVSLGIMRYFP